MGQRKLVAGGGLCLGAAVICMLFAKRPARAQHETVFNLPGLFDNENEAGKLLEAEVNFWITKIETHLKSFSTKMTKYDIIQRNFLRQLNDNDFNTSTEDPHDIVRALARDISRMIGKKEAALKRLMDTMENRGREGTGTRMSKSPYILGTTFYDARRLPKCLPGMPPRDGDCIELTSANPRFSVDINTSYSVVHIPRNVYSRDYEVLKAINASEQLIDTFKYNFKKDPYPSWQFFASATGVLRYYPAAEWQTDPEFIHDDVFDSRMRPWYIRAATSPKHMVILLDWSGSMTGLRREIAKHVVFTILDTLNDDDYFNIYKFAQDTEPVVPCLNETLVQANTENVDLFKATLNEGKTEYIANLSLALTRAFELLNKYNDSSTGGDKCNQAIMLVTDGSPDDYEDIFKKYNRPNTYVRVFTYLIGREVTDVREVHWMACANKGYFVHVTTLAEVKEQVLKYIPVMARPLVMYDKNPIVWSQVYADRVDFFPLKKPPPPPKKVDIDEDEGSGSGLPDAVTTEIPSEADNDGDVKIEPDLIEVVEPTMASIREKRFAQNEEAVEGSGFDEGRKLDESTQLSDWLWEKKQRQKQKFRYRNFRDIKRAIDYNDRQWFEDHGADKTRMKPGTVDEAYLKESYHKFLASGNLNGWPSPQAKREALRIPHKSYKFVTTVSMPALDKRDYVNVSERVLKHEAIWVEKIKEKRQANILGVVGIDVPIADFQMLAPHHKLGVNGYFFMVTNNGHIMFHRDFRPVFKDYMLKPNYNSVDLFEVELEDGVEGLFANDTRLLRMRKKIVQGQNGFEKKLRVKVPLDNLKRVAVYEQDYGFYPVQREDHPEARRSMPDAAMYTPHFRTPVPDGQVIFSLGAAWPSSYGRIKFTGHVEVSRDYTRKQRDVSQIMKTDRNWRLHPDWVYCSYHRKDIQRHRFENPEEELIHFLERMGRPPNFQWRPERVPLNDSDPENYFCDKDLVQYLLFDALATDVYNASDNSAKYDRPEDEPSVIRAFVATRSGLTRWRDYHKVPPDAIGAPITGDDYDDTEYYAEDIMWKENNAKAIDEPWYRRTVVFNEEDSEENSFVYSVPYDASNYNDCVVTATKTIFLHKPSDWYKKTPVAVVGFQFKHSYFSQIFMNVTRKCSTDPAGPDGVGGPSFDNCPLTCSKETLNCYLLDEHAWVLESEKPEDVGKFFGIIDPRIMDSLVQDDIYPKTHVYDYQGVCLAEYKRSGPGNTLINPFTQMASLATWFWSNLFWFVANANFGSIFQALGAFGQQHSFPIDYDPPSTHLRGAQDAAYYDMGGEDTDQRTYDADYNDIPGQAAPDNTGQHGGSPNGGSGHEDGDASDLEDSYGDYPDSFLVPQFEDAYINRTKPRPCPLEVDLVYLNVSKIRNTTIKGKLSDCGGRKGCARHFTVRKIPSTNLVFLAVETPCKCGDMESPHGSRRRTLTAMPREIEEIKNKTGEMRCQWLNRRLFRRRPSDCTNYHPEEEKIKDCSSSATSLITYHLNGLIGAFVKAAISYILPSLLASAGFSSILLSS